MFEVNACEILLAVLISVAIRWIISYISKLLRYPSGPWGLPLVGYLPWMDRNASESFIKISKKHGNIFSVTLGVETVVVLNDYSSIKEALINHPNSFNGRPPYVAIQAAISTKNIVFSDGPVWEVQRNLVIQCMKNSGLGKSLMESIVNDSIHDVIQTLLSNDGKIIEMKNMFFMPITKTTWRRITGRNMESAVHDKKFLDFSNDVRTLIKELRPDALFNIYSWLRFVPPNGFGFKPFIKANKGVLSYLKSTIDFHEKTLADGNEVDFIDHYLAKMKQNNGSGAPKPPYTMDHLMGSLWDMFLAGHDTTNATLLWGFLFLSCNSEVQIKAQKELDSVVGRNRLPNLDDFSKLPYTEAVIMEIHRLANVAPLSLPHLCMKTTKICNITIPEGAPVLQNIYAAHMDPNLWEEPTKFKPERFINENHEIKWPPYLMPFSIGPRLCVGKSVADLEIKLFISCLLHQFKFSLPPNRPKLSMESTIGLTIHPQPYCLLINSRNE
ncbi:hypothetical protein CHUAL_003525 [Chamberlinius hualienensis]